MYQKTMIRNIYELINKYELTLRKDRRIKNNDLFFTVLKKCINFKKINITFLSVQNINLFLENI